MIITPEQLEQAAIAFHDASFQTPWERVHPKSKGLYWDGMQAALATLGITVADDSQPKEEI